MAKTKIEAMVAKAISEAKITDIHTHLYPPDFGPLFLWGMDEMLTFHYLVSEAFRWIDIAYDKFWKMSKREQADLVWKTLFVDHSPVSEAARGVLTVLDALGLDVGFRNLDSYRSALAGKSASEYIDEVFKLANIESVVMTNDPFDDLERPIWLAGAGKRCFGKRCFGKPLSRNASPRFHAALRIDFLLNSWDEAMPRLKEWGYAVNEKLDKAGCAEVRRFLADWIERMNPLYLAASLPPSFRFPEDSDRGRLVAECVLPVAESAGIPCALMIGVKRQVNPDLRLAGDCVGKADIETVEYLCRHYPRVKFLVTMLSRENQHELCAAARKFRNLMVFGCWWFLNTPSLIEEITRMRVELLGTSFIPQHSDARVLEHVIYKWNHSRAVTAKVLADKYADLAATGWFVTENEIRRDVEALLGGNFWEFLGKNQDNGSRGP